MNVEHRTSNIERRILMTLRFIYFNSGDPQNFKGQLRFFRSFFLRMTEYLIRCWAFDVRCSMFNFSAFFAKKTT